MNTKPQTITIALTAEQYETLSSLARRYLWETDLQFTASHPVTEQAQQLIATLDAVVANPFTAEVCEQHPDRQAMYALVLDGPDRTVCFGACDECAHRLRQLGADPVKWALSPLVQCENGHWEGTDPECACFG